MQRKLVIHNSNLFLPSFRQFLQLAADWSVVALEISRKQRWFTALPTSPSALPLHLPPGRCMGPTGGGRNSQRRGCREALPMAHALQRRHVGCLWAWKDLGKLGTRSSWSTSSCSWERSPAELTPSSSRQKPRWMSLLLCIHLKYYDSL